MNTTITYSKFQFIFFIFITSVIYFAIGNISLHFVSLGYFYDFSTDIDNILPIIPGFVYLYILYYPIFISPAFVKINNQQRKEIIQKMLLLSIISWLVYLIFPAPPLKHDFTNIEPGLSLDILLWIYAIDIPVNLFPSLHVAHSVVITTAYWNVKELSLNTKYIFIFASFGLSISTFLVEQHYFLDFISGTLLAIFVILLYKSKQHLFELKKYNHVTPKG